jgi:hypothetical protein
MKNVCGLVKKTNQIVSSLYLNFPHILFYRTPLKTDANKPYL